MSTDTLFQPEPQAAFAEPLLADVSCTHARQVLDCDFAAIFLTPSDSPAQCLSVSGQRSSLSPHGPGGYAAWPAELTAIPSTDPLLLFGEATSSAPLPNWELVETEGLRTLAWIPLRPSAGQLAALLCGWRGDRLVSADQRQSLEGLRELVGAMLANELEHRETMRQRAEAQALAELVRDGAKEHDVDRAITLICDRTRDLLHADYATVALQQDTARRVWHGTSGHETNWQATTRGRGMGPTARALAEGHAIVLEHIDENPDRSRFHTREGGRTAVAAPFTARDGIAGALHLGWRSVVGIGPSQIRLAEAAAGYAAVILENAHAHNALEERAAALAESEAQLRRLYNDVEERVNERTAELRAANEELQAFSYSVSHDLRAPLRSMDGFCQLLLEDYGDRLDATAKDYLRRVRNASQRMAELIDDLLGLAQLTRAEMRRQRVDLSAMAQSIVKSLRERDNDRQVIVAIEPGLVTRGDPHLLRVLLQNLLQNAWKFTAKHATATIEVGQTTVEGERAFFVKDDGAGFDMTYIDKLFSPFQRLHGITEFEGSGIGLATVQRIVQRHGGRAWAKGQVEHGAAFYFTLGGPGRARPAKPAY